MGQNPHIHSVLPCTSYCHCHQVSAIKYKINKVNEIVTDYNNGWIINKVQQHDAYLASKFIRTVQSTVGWHCRWEIEFEVYPSVILLLVAVSNNNNTLSQLDNKVKRLQLHKQRDSTTCTDAVDFRFWQHPDRISAIYTNAVPAPATSMSY